MHAEGKGEPIRAELIMRRVALVIAFLSALTAPAFAQKAEIEAVNAKWMEMFNKGDFAGVASLYTEDATAFPPGSGIVKGRAAIGAMWKGMAELVGESHDTRRQGTRAFCGARDWHLQPENQGSAATGTHREVCRRVGEGRRRLEARD
jgi:ketosteroid isomerase-like protein